MQITQTYSASELGTREAGAGRKFLEFITSIPATLSVARAWSQHRPAHSADLKRAGMTKEMQTRILAMSYSTIE